MSKVLPCFAKGRLDSIDYFRLYDCRPNGEPPHVAIACYGQFLAERKDVDRIIAWLEAWKKATK